MINEYLQSGICLCPPCLAAWKYRSVYEIAEDHPNTSSKHLSLSGSIEYIHAIGSRSGMLLSTLVTLKPVSRGRALSLSGVRDALFYLTSAQLRDLCKSLERSLKRSSSSASLIWCFTWMLPTSVFTSMLNRDSGLTELACGKK